MALVVLSVVEQRLDAVRAVLAGESVVEVAVRYQVARSTLHRWIGRYLVWLIPGLLAFGISRPAIFTPASVGPFMAVPGEHRAFAASLLTEARQLGAVLGVAAMGLAYTVAGSTQLNADARVLADGFEAAMLTAAALVAVAAIVIAKRMPDVTVDG